jgi:N utilization substance protein A
MTGAVKVFLSETGSIRGQRCPVEVSLEDARELYPECSEEDLVYVEVTPGNFGRIAAQTAKQVVIQKLREAERSLIYEEFLEREGEIVTGTIQRIENKLSISIWDARKL